MRPESPLNPFVGHPPVAGDFERRRAELAEHTRRRVDRLHAELKSVYAKYGVADIHEAYDRMRRGDINIPKSDIRLMDKLISNIGAYMESGDQWDLDFELVTRNLPGSIQWLKQEMDDVPNTHRDEAWVLNAIAERLNVAEASPHLLSKKDFLERFLLILKSDTTPGAEKIDDDIVVELMGVIGMVVYNNLVERLPDPESSEQTIDLSGIGPVNGLGFKMSHGHLKILGTAGDGLGLRMTNGIIEAESANNYVGDSMEGGLIKVNDAGGGTGVQMKGGRIEVKNKIVSAAHAIQGGEIWVAGKRIK